jgi:hypothetical protein
MGVIDMSRIRHLTPIILVLFALFAVATSTAAAEEKTKVLPEATAAKPITSVAKGTEAILETTNGSTIKCKSQSGTGSLTSANHGTYTTLFTECKSILSTTCTGSGDPSGLIANHGEGYFLLALNTEGKLVGAFAALIAKFEFTCTATGISFPVTAEGCIAGKVPSADLNKLISAGEVDSEGTSKGKPNIALILLPEATKESECVLLTNIDSAGSEGTDIVGKVTSGTFKQSEKAVEVLLMNPEGL